MDKNYIIPPIPPIPPISGIGGAPTAPFGSGLSPTIASVVTNKPAIEARLLELYVQL